MSSVVPTTGVPAEPKTNDPRADEKRVRDHEQQVLDDLNDVREELSRMMADDFKEMSRPRPIARPLVERLTLEQREREDRRRKLHQREHQLEAELRTLQGF